MDEVLLNLAKSLLALIGNVDLAARIGVRRLGVLMPGTDTAGALDLCRQMSAASGEGTQNRAAFTRGTVDIGVASTGPACLGLSLLMEHAEVAMLSARSVGSGRIAYRSFS